MVVYEVSPLYCHLLLLLRLHPYAPRYGGDALSHDEAGLHEYVLQQHRFERLILCRVLEDGVPTAEHDETVVHSDHVMIGIPHRHIRMDPRSMYTHPPSLL